MEINPVKIPEDLLSELDLALRRTGKKTRYNYQGSGFFLFFEPFSGSDLDDIVRQTGALSDFEEHQRRGESIQKNEYTTIRIRANSRRSNTKSHLKRLLNPRNLEVEVYNPKIIVPEIDFRQKSLSLAGIYSLDSKNRLQGRVNFLTGDAVLREEDQEIAHELRLMYTPLLNPEDNRILIQKNSNEQGEEIYCDNPFCQREIRNPILVIDYRTGNFYHSDICYKRGSKPKIPINDEFAVRKIALHDAKKLIERGLVS